MRGRLVLCVVLLTAGVTRCGAESRAAQARPATRAARATAAREGVAARPAPRTLQDIHIEGEIPVPQVLFITARDQRRFVDFQHRRYLRTSQEVGSQTVFPSEIVLIGSPPAHEPKETIR
jgi:hypothetical protein